MAKGLEATNLEGGDSSQVTRLSTHQQTLAVSQAKHDGLCKAVEEGVIRFKQRQDKKYSMRGNEERWCSAYA